MDNSCEDIKPNLTALHFNEPLEVSNHNSVSKLGTINEVQGSVTFDEKPKIKIEFPDENEELKTLIKQEINDIKPEINVDSVETDNSLISMKTEVDLGKLEAESDDGDLVEYSIASQPVELICQICDLSFPLRSSYDLHIQTDHSSRQNMTCKFCSAIFDEFEQFNFHFFSHLKKKKCCICKVPLDSIEEHRHHYWLKHFETQEETVLMDVKPDISRKECPKCGAVYDNKKLFTQHLKSHDMFYPCEICDKKFSDGNALKCHVVRCHTSIRNFVCKFCQKAFAHQKDLKTHIRTHDETMKFKCDSCEETFNYRVALKSHINLVHKNICPYKCQLCEKSFPTSIGLSKHRRKHETEKKMECYLCGLKFKYSGNLFDHLKRCHPDTKPITCTICNKNFSSPLTLEKHSKLHTKKPIIKEEVLGC